MFYWDNLSLKSISSIAIDQAILIAVFPLGLAPKEVLHLYPIAEQLSKYDTVDVRLFNDAVTIVGLPPNDVRRPAADKHDHIVV